MNYISGKIYKIIDLTNNNIYIGSTVKDLNKRLNQHEYEYKRYLSDNSIYITTSIEVLKNNNYMIQLIEELNITDKKQLLQRERHYIESLECVNNNTPNRTHEEKLFYDKSFFKSFYNNNKEKHLTRVKLYNEQNKEKILEYQRQYRLSKKINKII